MSMKRRDNKNRILHTGESQRKDGRYAYKYIDNNGQQQFVYSWKLEATDKLPTGKRNCVPLREKEKQILNSLHLGLITNSSELSVLQLVEKYIMQRTNIKQSTVDGYNTVINFLKIDPFGKLRIDKIKPSDAKLWLIKLQQEYSKGYSTIHTIRGVVRPAFEMALNDDLVRKNPFNFPLAEAIIDDSAAREALSPKDKRLFLEFIRNDKHYCKYYDAIFILFDTGMRISEFVGLTLSDLDFKERKIIIDHQLQRTSKMEYIIVDTTKTKAGMRELPMSDETYQCFTRIVSKRNPPKVEPIIQGKAGFLFFDKNDMPLVALHWEKYFEHICKKYNKTYKVQLPKVTPHICRHTYCTDLARKGMNPKNLQYLMGHADIATTLNVYTHLGFEDAKNDLKKLKLLKNA